MGVNKEEVISRDRHKDMHNDQKRNKGKERIKDDFGIFIVRKYEKKVLVTQFCLTLCDPMDCTPPGSSAHGILQAKILEWVAVSYSRGFSQPRD